MPVLEAIDPSLIGPRDASLDEAMLYLCQGDSVAEFVVAKVEGEVQHMCTLKPPEFQHA